MWIRNREEKLKNKIYGPFGFFVVVITVVPKKPRPVAARRDDSPQMDQCDASKFNSILISFAFAS